jgi:hypothetical protein
LVDKRDFNTNMKIFKVPEASINSIYSKLAMRYSMYTRIFSNVCIAPDSAGVQQGRRPSRMPNRPPVLSLTP